MSLESDWRWADANGQQRLVRTDELRAALASGLIAPNTPVWRRGWKEWKPAYDVPELTTSALAAANGLVPNIPPPPLAVVAVQHQFEGEPSAVRKEAETEPPPPPSYVPAPTRPQHGLFHTPSVPMKVHPVPSRMTPPPPSHPPASQRMTPHPPPSAPSQTASTRVNLPPLHEADAGHVLARGNGKPGASTVIGVPQIPPDPPSTARHLGDDRNSSQPPIAIPTISLQTLTRQPAASAKPPTMSSRPPPLPPKSTPRLAKPGGQSSKPPPPPAMKPRAATMLLSYEKSAPEAGERRSSAPPIPRASTPPRANGKRTASPGHDDAPPSSVEELSGSILLPDQSGSAEELSGSILLPDQSGGVEELSGSILLPDQSGAAPKASTEELSASFLLDAGSTGALPSVESAGAILAAAKDDELPPTVPGPSPDANAAWAAAGFHTPNASTTSHANADAHASDLAVHAISSEYAAPTHSASATILGMAAPVVGNAAMEERPSSAPPHSSPFAAPHAPAAGAAPAFDAPVAGAAPAFDAPVAGAAPATHPRVEPVHPGFTHSTLAGGITAPVNVDLTPAPPPVALEGQPSASHRVPPIEPGPYSDSNAPMPERSSARLHDMSSIRPGLRNQRYLVPALAGLGVLVGIGMLGLIIGALRKKPSELDAPNATSSAASAPGTAASVPGAAGSPDPHATAAGASTASATSSTASASPSAGTPAAACTVAGPAHVIAPRAVVQSGVEVQQVGPARLALGFASGPRDGMAVSIDPVSLAASQTVRTRAPDVIRRIMPLAASRGLGVAGDFDGRRDRMQGRRTVNADPPFDVGAADGSLGWAAHRTEKIAALWPLEGDAPVEALRAAPLDPSNKDAGWAIAFRRGTSIYAGAVSGGRALTPKGPLVQASGLGPQVGSPAIAANGDAILVAWADRAGTSDPWGLRWMRFAPGDASGDPRAFTPAEGGLGGQAMSPAIAPAGPGRFLLVWTEGPVANHQVRAQTLSPAGVPLGAPIAISGDGVNAGQAQLAVLPDGRGVVAYLAAREPSGKTYEVMATPISCP